MNSEDTEVSDDPWLDGRTSSLEVGYRSMAYTLEENDEDILSPFL